MRNINYKTDRTYKSWEAMKSRCQNVRSPYYNDYGLRGITVCESWQSFDNFLADMGLRPPNRTIGRIDNDLGYYKANCSWQTNEEQRRNTRRNVLTIELVQLIRKEAAVYTGSKRQLSYKLADRLNINFETIRDVLKGRAWSDV